MSRRLVFRIAVAVVLAAVVIGLWFSPLREQLTRENVRSFVEHLRGLWYGPIAFIAVFAAACVFALPASVFCIAAGFIWGWLLGGTYALIGGMLGATASFYLGRFIGEGVLDRFGRVGRMVRKLVDHAGFRSMFVARNIPGIPFAVLNYGAGVCGVRFRDFLPATVLGVIPAMYVFAYCADALFNGTMNEGDVAWRILLACALMLGFALLPVAVRKWVGRPTVE